MFQSAKLSRVLFGLLLVGCSGDVSSNIGEEGETQGLEQGLVANDPCAVVRCEGGTHCVAQGNTATCEPNVFCGGIAAFPCPGAGQCLDDPNDDCDPENGGADCGGVCDCSGVSALCIEGTVFDPSPEVCTCVEQAPENPCNLIDCQSGYICQLNNGEPVCVAPVSCGGITGEGCAGAGECVDDPTDDCDPENGGADCGGSCQCSGALVLCAPNTVFDESPDVCACVEAPNVGCEAVLCITGTHCVERAGEAQCVPNRHRPRHKPWRHHHHRGHGKRHR